MNFPACASDQVPVSLLPHFEFRRGAAHKQCGVVTSCQVKFDKPPEQLPLVT